jgi:ribonucleoside-diphosphate reductase alpha chain
MLSAIKKRNGNIVEFNKERIFQAILKASHASQSAKELLTESPMTIATTVTTLVIDKLKADYNKAEYILDVETIQDVVEQELVHAGYFKIARRYILYRAEHKKLRIQNTNNTLEKINKNLLTVTKRNGKRQIFSAQKVERVFNLVNSGFEGKCKFAEVYQLLKAKIIDGIQTSEILNVLKYACLDLISTDNINWQNVAGRLYTLQIYKKACVNRKISLDEIYKPQSFITHFTHYIEQGLYFKSFMRYYSLDDITKAAHFIQKERDFDYIYSTVLLFDKRYLNNPNGVVQELPQEMYLSIALFLAIPEAPEQRLSIVKEIYDATSTQKLSLPTPTLLNARTNFNQLASCFKLNVGDDLREIYHNIENVAQISKFGGGVGVYLGNIRSRGSYVRNIKGASGGVIPWIKVINDTACAVNQLGSRKGAVSPTLDIWHRDIQDFLHLQTETGDIRSKAFDIFPAISIPDIFMKRVEENLSWTLFDPYEVHKVTGKRLQDFFGEEFDQFYTECEANSNIHFKDAVLAKDLMKEFLKTAVETGMPYVFFRDTVNYLNPNKHTGNIYSTQLCTEICQNTIESKFDCETLNKDGKIELCYIPGETVVCNLASINIAKVHTDEEIATVIPVAMRVLDNTITLNFYPIKEAELTSTKYRSVGLGFMGLAEYLACKGHRYDSLEAREHIDDLFEKYAYMTFYSSNQLAKERGTYELYNGSEWYKGKLLGREVSWYQQNTQEPQKWIALFNDIKSYGLRFAYHLAPAPNTSTANVVGTTAGLLPIYKKFYVDTGAVAPIVTVAPNLSQENFWYYKEYINMDMNDVIDMITVIYKWVDQSISFEWLITPEKTSPQELYSYYMKAWKQKIKTIYYLRSMSGDASQVCDSCSG